MSRKGVTLIEMLIVIVIIGIITAVAIPGYIGQQKRAARAEAYSNLENIRLLEEQFFSENGQYAPTAAPLTRNYNATAAIDNGIEDIFRFQPGGQSGLACLGLHFTYSVTQNIAITNATTNPPTTGASTPCFVATATGCSSRVTGDVFAIDCNNNRNF